MNFKEDGLESKFRTDTVVSGPGQRSCGEPEFPSVISSFLILRRNWTNVLLYPIN